MKYTVIYKKKDEKQRTRFASLNKSKERQQYIESFGYPTKLVSKNDYNPTQIDKQLS